jgi:hypothetical protein
MWQNVVQPSWPHDNNIWHMRISYWITKATNTHLNILSVCFKYFNNYCFFTATIVSKRARILYVHCLSRFLLCAVLFPGVLTVKTRRWERRCTLPRFGDPVGGLRPNYVAYVFVFLGGVIICIVNKLTLSDHAQVALQVKGRAFSSFCTSLQISCADF